MYPSAIVEKAESDPEFEKGGSRIENRATPIALPGSDPGYGVI
jgi:hypothetical protein